MSGQVKLNHYSAREVFFPSTVITSSPGYSPVVDNREWRRSIVTFEWSAYDDTDGNVFIQISNKDSSLDSDWDDYGDPSKGTLNASSGTCIFDWSVMPPGFFRICVELGSGSTITATASHVLGH